MAPVYALDHFYLVITLFITTGYQLVGFFIAWTLQFDKITDFTGGSNFFILALVTLLLGNTFHARNIVASVLVMAWAVRIAGFLLYRVLKMGSDTRFDEIRSHFFKFLGFWIAQILWVWVVSLPVTILNSPAVSDLGRTGSNPPFGTGRDIAGVILWALGFIIESVADLQKLQFKLSLQNKGKFIKGGLWAWSRHPPYFGEILCWWGIWIVSLSPTTNGGLAKSAQVAQNVAVLSPIFTTLILLFGSGMPTAEKPQAKRYYQLSQERTEDSSFTIWHEYQEYLHSTSILIPLPPAIYRRLPKFLKQTLLLDLPFYQFHAERDIERTNA
ncbi:DUF1295-domain-containing protein [Pluteus cervinus]|uniref:DUF1295-domain-containing protein n=1 Tax=Pluteus cervinus TaxID=181527 RepID=A0ACD3B1Z6_9AGAR|nr:DUF1295-domain-containing protein [Pluteus cervinus]